MRQKAMRRIQRFFYKKKQDGLTLIELMITLIISTAILIASISSFNSTWRTKRVDDMFEDISAIKNAALVWHDTFSSDEPGAELRYISRLCVSNPSEYAIIELGPKQCGAANDGVQASPFAGDYSISGYVAPPEYRITATKVPEVIAHRLYYKFAQETNMAASVVDSGDNSVLTVTYTSR